MVNQIKVYLSIFKNAWLLLILIVLNTFFCLLFFNSLGKNINQIKSNIAKDNGYILISDKVISDKNSYILFDPLVKFYKNEDTNQNVYVDLIMVVPDQTYDYYNTPNNFEAMISKNIATKYNIKINDEILISNIQSEITYKVIEIIGAEYGLIEQKLDINKGVILLGYNDLIIDNTKSIITLTSNLQNQSFSDVNDVFNIMKSTTNLLRETIPVFLLFLTLTSLLWVFTNYLHVNNKKMITRLKEDGGDNKLIINQSALILIINLLIIIISTTTSLIIVKNTPVIIAFLPLLLFFFFSIISFIKLIRRKNSYVSN